MLLTLTRWLFVAGLLSSFGAAVFLRVVISDISPGIERRCRRVAESSIVVAHIAGFGWLLVEAGAMAETATLAETLAALPTVLLGTWFGNVLLAQAIALAGTGTALALFPRRRRAASRNRFLRLPMCDRLREGA
jgi:putative copper resistance protein D